MGTGSGASEGNNRGMIAFSGTTLFAVSTSGGGTLRTLDLVTGTYSAPIGSPDGTFAGLSLFGVGTSLFGVSSPDDHLYSINTESGLMADLGLINGTLPAGGFVGAYFLVPVPEPGFGLGQAAISLMAVVWIRRRREKGAGKKS